MSESVKVLILEPFFGGSHKQLIDTLQSVYSKSASPFTFSIFTLPPKKWPWRARCGALMLSEKIPSECSYDTLLCSSDLNLSELLGIRPELHKCKKVVYFHENQLVYPVQKTEKLDFQFGYNQVLTAVAADIVLFNSRYNMQSFLQSIPSFLQKIPDYKPRNVVEKIRNKCKVQYFPIDFDAMPRPVLKPNEHDSKSDRRLHIVWAHRWEYDKDPKTFFDTLFELQDNGVEFYVSVLGQGFTDVPAIFSEAKAKLKEGSIKHWGYLPSRAEYLTVLRSCDVAVSTAVHEFFGVSMMECFYSGCYPLCPNRLVYPELYPRDCLYNTGRQLYKKLREFCRKPWLACELRKKIDADFTPYSSDTARNEFFDILNTHCKDDNSDVGLPSKRIKVSEKSPDS